jgi:hypothetical protein
MDFIDKEEEHLRLAESEMKDADNGGNGADWTAAYAARAAAHATLAMYYRSVLEAEKCNG